MTDLRRAHSTQQKVFSGLVGGANVVVVTPTFREVAILHRVIFSDSALATVQFNSGAVAIGPLLRNLASDTPDLPELGLRATKGQTLNFDHVNGTALSVFVEYSLTRLQN
jgi:hypothetical protein